MPKFKLTLKGNKAVLSGFKKLSEETEKKVQQQIVKSTWEIQQGAASRVPVDTGFLKGSISVQEARLMTRIEVEKLYAPFVEFGTGGLVDVPAGLEEYAMQFKGKDIKQVNMPARPFLFPAFEQERPKLIENIKKAINQK